jgi:hypothetical protein
VDYTISDMRTLSFCLFATLLLLPSAVRAQRPTGRIEGEIVDSVHARPAVGAVVTLTRMAPEPSQFFSTATDEKGRYHFDTLSAGRYSVDFTAGVLDSLELFLPAHEVALAAGEHARWDFAVPSGATLRSAGCPGLTLPKGQGGAVGRVTDADSDAPLRDARIVVSWATLSIDRATLQPVSEPRAGSVAVDSLGRYRLCGVPTDTYLLVQVQHAGRAGNPLRFYVPDDVGLVVRHLSFSAGASRSISELDSAARVAEADTLPPAPLTGTATLTGTVRGPDGRPMANAQTRVTGAAGTARTDSLGRFVLNNLPAGTQLLETRHVGYRLGETPVDLRSGKSTDILVSLVRIASLDSIRVVARRPRYREFENRSRGFGRFLNEQEIEKRNAMETSDLLRMIPGFQVIGGGFDTRVVSSRNHRLRGSCDVNIVIDGFQHQDINLVSPQDIGALEAYSGPAGAPMEYDSSCGVVVLWTKR